VLPHTIWSVDLWTVKNRLGEGVNKLGSIGSSVMVARMVGVKVGRGVSVMIGVPVGGVVVGGRVLITNKSGVFEAGNPKGVAVGPGVLTVVGVCRKGSEIGNPEQPERREIMTIIKIDLLISPLIHNFLQIMQRAGAYAIRFAPACLSLMPAAPGPRG
jgi:hypothetical protein